MFERFVRLAQARSALKQGRFEAALRLVEDPIVRDERRAATVRAEALEGLVARARARIAAGEPAMALSDLDGILQRDPEHRAANAARAEAQARLEDAGVRQRAGQEALAGARAALERGELEVAERLCASAAATLPGGAAEVRQRIAARRVRAAAAVARAEGARRERRFDEAAQWLHEARVLDAADAGAAEEARRLAEAWGDALAAELRESDAGPGAGWQARWQNVRALLPELEAVPAVQRGLLDLAGEERRRFVERLEADDVEGALAGARGLRVLPGLGALVDALEMALGAERRGDFATAEEGYRELASELDSAALERRAAAAARAGAEIEPRLSAARAAASEGRLVDARAALLAVLEAHPHHETARRELEIVDRSAVERAERVARARELARDGRLAEAATLVITLAVPGGQGEDARLLLREIRQKQEVVQAGVRQVLRSLHGRESATREGLLHCRERLAQLAVVQCDAPELERTRAAVDAELRGLDLLGEAAAAVEHGDAPAVQECLTELRGLRERLLDVDRLRAREVAVLDEALRVVRRRLDAGRPGLAERLLAALAPLAGDHGGFAEAVAELRQRTLGRRRTADEEVAAARSALRRRDLAAAEEHLEEARLAAADARQVEVLEQEVAQLRGREAQLASVEALAKRRDFGGAQRQLERMGPTPDVLRTRIFDLKRSLAAAQGFGDAFLLRVDEGGEFLVVRSDTVSIGNLREGTADLPLLASMAGRHARLRRTMSFHGGVEDTIEADRGTVLHDDRPVPALRLGDGTRVRLGSVGLEYRLPSARSVTALLCLRGGFQVAGCDRILWMKDRGRDGRILIGNRPDAHVSVPRASGEVEVYADRDGRIRVVCEAGGTLDDRPFRGDHPATQGSWIRCGEIAFVLLPWTRP